MKKNLLLGCGHDRRKKLAFSHEKEWIGELITLDVSPVVGADVVWDLNSRPLPFNDEEFDEIHAYDVLEHLGKQGDWKLWFDEFAEYYRMLKPGGKFFAIVPVGQDALADPGHCRFIHSNWFCFLNQNFYEVNLKQNCPVSDYRYYWKLNFEILELSPVDDHHLTVVMLKV